MTSNTEKHALPPHAVMNSLMDGFVRTQIIAVAAELRVADALHSGPLSIDQITDTVEADSTALGRVMRSLASTGIFTENSDGLFGQTPLSETLRSDAPGTMRDFAILYGQEWYRRPWARLTDTVRSGDAKKPNKKAGTRQRRGY